MEDYVKIIRQRNQALMIKQQLMRGMSQTSTQSVEQSQDAYVQSKIRIAPENGKSPITQQEVHNKPSERDTLILIKRLVSHDQFEKALLLTNNLSTEAKNIIPQSVWNKLNNN